MTEPFNSSTPSIKELLQFFAPSQTAFVCLSLLSFVFEVQKKVALQSAYHSLSVQQGLSHFQEGSFIEVALQSVERQAIMEVAMLFDRAKFRNESNCSFQLLKEKLESEKCGSESSKQQLDMFLQQIDDLCEKCEQVLPRDIRNKQLAHHDMKRLQELREDYVIFDDLLNLLNDATNLIAEIGSVFCANGLGEICFPPFSDLESYYKSDILHTFGILEN